jgi:hypothetical protein
MPLSGSWLEFFKEFVEVGGANINSDAISLRDDELDDLIKAAKGSAREALLREKLMLYLICDGAPWDPRDWPAMRKHVTEFITGKTSAGHLALKAPKDFDVPPVHHTESNCWTCGIFAPYDELDKEDFTEGWVLVKNSGQVVKVTCPTCAKKVAKSKPAAKKGAK